MKKKQDFTQSVFVLAEYETSTTSKHVSEKDARNAMKRKDSSDCVIIRVSSNGADNTPPAASYKQRSTGWVETKIIHKGKDLSNGIVERIRKDAEKRYGNQLKDAANRARNLASEKGLVLNLGG